MIEIIKERRLELFITQANLAVKSGVSQGSISKIENGETSPSVELFFKLLNALKLKIKFEEIK